MICLISYLESENLTEENTINDLVKVINSKSYNKNKYSSSQHKRETTLNTVDCLHIIQENSIETIKNISTAIISNFSIK